MLQIAIPNKGSLSEGAVRLVSEAGYRCRRYGRELFVRDAVHGIDFIFLRPRDIAVYVANGVVDAGITGRDLACDSEVPTAELLALGFAKSKFHYAVPKESSLSPDDFTHLRIATSYSRVVKDDMAKRKVSVDIVHLEGAVEISIELGVAEAIADVVESGRTLYEAGLKTTGEPILVSEAILITRDRKVSEKEAMRVFIQRLKGIVVGREYVMMEYDAPEDILERAYEVTPGIEAPTVSPLSRKGWVAVKAMVKCTEVNRIMDELWDMGARGIIVTDIRNCRI